MIPRMSRPAFASFGGKLNPGYGSWPPVVDPVVATEQLVAAPGPQRAIAEVRSGSLEVINGAIPTRNALHARGAPAPAFCVDAQRDVAACRARARDFRRARRHLRSPSRRPAPGMGASGGRHPRATRPGPCSSGVAARDRTTPISSSGRAGRAGSAPAGSSPRSGRAGRGAGRARSSPAPAICHARSRPG